MKKLQQQLISVTRALATLLKEVEKLTLEIAELRPVKNAAPAKKITPKKKTAPTKKVAPEKKAAPVKKVAPEKKAAPVKKVAPEKKAAPVKSMTVLELVYEIIRKSKNGATIAKLKEKTLLSPRQLSNAVYKLKGKGKVVSKSRGIYIKKK